MISEVCQFAVTPEAHKQCPGSVNGGNCQCSCHPNTARTDKESTEQTKVQTDRAEGLSEVGSGVSNAI
jgi:hypothetical protein